jgi:hypothetical protein
MVGRKSWSLCRSSSVVLTLNWWTIGGAIKSMKGLRNQKAVTTETRSLPVAEIRSNYY